MNSARVRRPRRGFTMLTVLWVIVVSSIAAMAGALAGRNAVFAGRNRVQLERARWAATGCARRALAAIDGTLREAPSFEDAARVWRTIHRVALSSPLVARCEVTMEAAGTKLDVNAASVEMLESMFLALGHGVDAHSMASAIADWRDTSGALADPRELARIRGFEDSAPFDTLLGIEPGRVSLATAPIGVLIAVPGFTSETAERIVALQEAGTPVGDLASVIGSLSSSSQTELLARYSEAVRLTTADPDAWVLSSRASSGQPPTAVLLQWRLVRAGRRAVVVRTRSRL